MLAASDVALFWGLEYVRLPPIRDRKQPHGKNGKNAKTRKNAEKITPRTIPRTESASLQGKHCLRNCHQRQKPQTTENQKKKKK